jgi:hypothetical protein
VIQIHSTANVGTDGIKCLIYGGSGMGKTPSLATAPGPIIISAESGLLSLKYNNPPIPYIPIRNLRDLNEAALWARDSNEARQFWTVALDSISEVMEVLLDEEKAKNKDPRKAYGELLDQGLKITRFFRDLPNKCIVVVAKEEYSKDDTTGIMQYGPMLPGSKLGQQLPYFFDETFQLVRMRAADNKEYPYFRTQRTFQHVARDRSGRLAEFEPTNLTNIFTKILAP